MLFHFDQVIFHLDKIHLDKIHCRVRPRVCFSLHLVAENELKTANTNLWNY